jgi:glyceraldehyde-3-phosphate dehydrogenase (NAD(P))
MKIRVGIDGATRSARRIADAVIQQSDMLLAGISGCSHQCKLRSAHGYDIVESTQELASAADVLIDASGTTIRVLEANDDLDFTQQNGTFMFSSLTTGSDEKGPRELVIPGPDILALARVVKSILSLTPINRLYTTIICRGSHAADAAGVSLDALEPVVHETEFDAQMALVFDGVVPIHHARRVIASYTHSHLHMLKLDLSDAIECKAIASALEQNSRILVGSVEDGFRSTADINEFFRDLGRPRGDRWESFVWDKSIMSIEKSAYLMLDISPEAIAIPEIIDAIRLLGNPQLEWNSIRQRTDKCLGLLQSIAV